MKVPVSQQFSSIPTAGVFTNDAVHYFFKLDATSFINLADAGITTSVAPSTPFVYLPGVTIVLT